MKTGTNAAHCAAAALLISAGLSGCTSSPQAAEQTRPPAPQKISQQAPSRSFTANALETLFNDDPDGTLQTLQGQLVRVNGTIEMTGPSGNEDKHSYVLFGGEEIYGKGLVIQMEDDVTTLVPGNRSTICAEVYGIKGNAVLLTGGKYCR